MKVTPVSYIYKPDLNKESNQNSYSQKKKPLTSFKEILDKEMMADSGSTITIKA